MSQYTKGLLKVLQDAGKIQRDRSHSLVTCLHVLLAFLKDQTSPLVLALSAPGVDQATESGSGVERLSKEVDRALSRTPEVKPVPQGVTYGSDVQTALHTAEDVAKASNSQFIGAPHLLIPLLDNNEVVKCLQVASINRFNLIKEVESSVKGKSLDTEDAEDGLQALQKYCIDMTQKARDGKVDPCIGRDKEIRQLTEILSRRVKNNPVLTGDAGVGKTQIVEGLARRIVQDDVPESLDGCRIFAVDISSLLAGASYRGQFEERLKGVLDAAKNSNRKIILFFDELHTLFGSGGSEGRGDAANLLKPALARGEVRVIGATTQEEFRRYVAADKAFERRFSPVHVAEPSIEDTISILRGVADIYSAHHGVAIEDGALVSAAKLAERYLRPMGRRNPDAALDLLDEACASLRVSLDSQPEIIDQLTRKKTRLEIEAQSLKRELKDVQKDETKARIQDLEKEIEDLDKEIGPVLHQYQKEREVIDQLAAVKAKLTSYRDRLEQHQARREIDQASEVKYMILDAEEKAKTLQNQLDKLRQKGDSQLLRNTVTAQDIANQVSKKTGIPAAKLTASERQKALLMAEQLSAKVVGQPEAVNAVTDAILRQRARIQRSNQPLGSFFFLGSTGCGKTRLAQEIATSLYDDPGALIRIDLSEYMEEHSVSRLIGAPPGYVGHESGGQLTEAVFRRRFCVVLLDEVEKAHPKVLQILLQVLDEGRLTDGKGTEVDFTNAVVILTSNVGSQLLLEAAENGDFEAGKRQALDLLKRKMPPELLNRFDDIIFFNPLSREHMQQIFDIQFEELAARVRGEYNMDVHVSNDVKAAAIEQADIVYGARPLRRYIEQKLGTALARLLLSGESHIQSNGFDMTITGNSEKRQINIKTI